MLTREDFAEGRIVLSQKLEEFSPRVVAFNGRLTFEQFAQRKCKFGLQKERLYGARVFVLPAIPGGQPAKKKEAILQFRKLAALVKRVEKERDTNPAGTTSRSGLHSASSHGQSSDGHHSDQDESDLA
jgi:hypothetical protein